MIEGSCAELTNESVHKNMFLLDVFHAGLFVFETELVSTPAIEDFMTFEQNEVTVSCYFQLSKLS